MIVNVFRTVGWWIIEAIAAVLFGIRGIWRISRKPYGLVEKKYMVIKILTTLVKIAIVVYILTFALAVILAVVVGIGLVKSFFSSAESGMRNNF